jgi:hypothetical protein
MLGVIVALLAPSKFTAVTPSDSTDISAFANRGLYVAATGTVFVRGIGDTTIVSLGTQQVGTFIPGRFCRVGASTAATIVACGS